MKGKGRNLTCSPRTNHKTESIRFYTSPLSALVSSLWQRTKLINHVFLVATTMLINSMLSTDVCMKIQQLN